MYSQICPTDFFFGMCYSCGKEIMNLKKTAYNFFTTKKNDRITKKIKEQ
jgi:hypothetical protein